MLFFFGLGFAAIFRAGFRAGFRAALAVRFDDDLLALFRADFFADFRLPVRAAALDADFFLACFFAFFAGRAGFFRAMTNPFRLS